MYRKVIMVIAIAALLVGFKTGTAYADDTIKTIGLKSATDSALINNADLKLLNEKISLAQSRYDKATDGTDKNTKAKELEDYRWQLEDMKKNIEIDTTKLYHEILIKQNQITLQKDIIARLNKEYDSKKKEVDLGRDTSSSLIPCQINTTDAEVTLIGLENDRDGLVMDLNIEMGEGINQKLSLVAESQPEATLDINNVNEIAIKLPSLDHSVLMSLKDLSILQDQENDSTGDTRHQYHDQALSLKYDINNQKAAVERQVLSDYNDILNSKDQMEINSMDFDKYTKLADIARIKYEHGMISSIEYDKAKHEMLNAQYIYVQSKLDYYVEIKKYKLFIEPAQK